MYEFKEQGDFHQAHSSTSCIAVLLTVQIPLKVLCYIFVLWCNIILDNY
jgi:hypothetical protein